MQKSSKEVYITRNIAEPGLSIISKECNVVVNRMARAPTKKEIIKNIGGKAGLVCTVSDSIDAEVIEAACPSLKVISTYSSGYDHIDVKEATSRGIYVTSASYIPAEATADLTFGLICACARNIVAGDRFVRKKNWIEGWSPQLMVGYDIYGATLGIVGLGSIGLAVARRAKGFGMRVLYHDLKRNYKVESELGVRYVSLEELLIQSDFVSIHASLGTNSINMINKSSFEMMKRTAFLINTSRGQIVNQTDLVLALKSKRIAGAGLDVFESEPIQGTSPLLKLENAIILPHIGCASHRTRAKMSEVIANSLLEILNDREPHPSFIVNPEVRRVITVRT